MSKAFLIENQHIEKQSRERHEKILEEIGWFKTNLPASNKRKHNQQIESTRSHAPRGNADRTLRPRSHALRGNADRTLCVH
jgi:hypothetical protein